MKRRGKIAKSVGNFTLPFQPCERTNLWQAIALLAARHNIPVDSVAAGLGLEKHGGVVVLAREDPWAAPEPTLAASLPEQRA